MWCCSMYSVIFRSMWMNRHIFSKLEPSITFVKFKLNIQVLCNVLLKFLSYLIISQRFIICAVNASMFHHFGVVWKLFCRRKINLQVCWRYEVEKWTLLLSYYSQDLTRWLRIISIQSYPCYSSRWDLVNYERYTKTNEKNVEALGL